MVVVVVVMDSARSPPRSLPESMEGHVASTLVKRFCWAGNHCCVFFLFSAGRSADAKRLMSQCSVQSELSVGSPPPHLDESESSPQSSPPPVAAASIKSETVHVQTRYGSVDDSTELDKTPSLGHDLVLTGTEDIVKPTPEPPSDKISMKPKLVKGKVKKMKHGTFVERKKVKGKVKGRMSKKKVKSAEFISEEDDVDVDEPVKEVVAPPVVPAAALGRKKDKRKKPKMRTNPSLTIRTDLPVRDPRRGSKSPRGRSPKRFKPPSISIISPISTKGPRSPRCVWFGFFVAKQICVLVPNTEIARLKLQMLTT